MMKMIKKLILCTVLLGLALAFALLMGRFAVDRAAQDRIYTATDAIPKQTVGLVLGCSPQLADGRPNLFFRYRMDAAADLFKAGKVHYLLVSGANPSEFYNEPAFMRAALIERGVPPERIFKDYAGLRTLDSIVRAKEVFQTDRFTIISQDFHVRRALYIADRHDMDCIGFAARDVHYRHGARTMVREQLARVKMLLDLHVLGVQPRHLGDPITIGTLGD